MRSRGYVVSHGVQKTVCKKGNFVCIAISTFKKKVNVLILVFACSLRGGGGGYFLPLEDEGDMVW